MIKIYHNSRCRKSREVLSLLQKKEKQFEVIEYLKNIPSEEELRRLIERLGIKPIELIRKGEAEYKELYKGKELSDDEWIRVMQKHPKLIERPIVVNGDQAIVGRPPESILSIL